MVISELNLTQGVANLSGVHHIVPNALLDLVNEMNDIH